MEQGIADNSVIQDDKKPDHHQSHEPIGCCAPEASGGSHSGHHDHAAMFRNKFWISLALTIPTVFYSHMLQDLFNYQAPQFQFSHWVAPVFGLATFIYGGRVFLESGLSEIKAKKPGMMLLISMGLTVALFASIATTLNLIDVDLWFELATLVTIMLLGHWIEMRAVGQTQDALSALAKLLPEDAEVVIGDEISKILISELKLEDVVLVRAGGRVPADGIIIEGSAELDESMLTGESKVVAKTLGDKVVAGTVVTDSAVRLRINAVGENTALAGISRLVAEAQTSRSRAQALADRFAAQLFYFAVLAGFLTFVIWSAIGNSDRGIENTVTVLVIACPHALGLAIPLTISVSTGLAARSGILIKDRMALEKMRTIDTVLFDKTGTLTQGEHVVVDLITKGIDQSQFVQIASAVEADSEHPLARAVIRYAQGQIDNQGESNLVRATDFHSIPGRGVQAQVGGKKYSFGGPALLRDLEAKIPSEFDGKITEWKQRGASILYSISNEKVIGAIALEDAIRPESKNAIAQLKKLGVRTAMVTGDADQVARAVGKELGIDEIFSEVLPEDKDRIVSELQSRKQSVAMVGDGVNDAPALARADVGIAIGAGTDVAIESAGVVLASSDPNSVLATIKLSGASYSKMVQNLVWGAGYNLVAIPLAAGMFTFAGLSLSPAVGAILMSLSTVIVAFNAQLLRRVKLVPR